MFILEMLAPLGLLIGLGAVLAHIRFLGETFMADLNKLAFWVTLPALLFITAGRAAAPGSQTWLLLAVVLGGTFGIILLAWGVCHVLRLPRAVHGTLMQSAFRGNLFYIAVPVLTYSLAALSEEERNQAMASAVIVMMVLMGFYNVLAVIVLQTGRHASVQFVPVAKSILTNPLLIAGIAGIIVPFLNLHPPHFIELALESLAAAAVPISLLCIGGSMVVTPLVGRRSLILTAALLKVAVLPALIFGLSRWAGLGTVEQRIAVVIGACPTAAVAFVMAREMGGDKILASGSIALSTMLSAISLGVVLWLTH